MTPPDTTIFGVAAGIADPAARAAYLAAALPDQPDRRADIERVVAALNRAGGFLTAPPVGAGDVLAGRYALVEPLGRGGMGTVWLAQQVAPVRRPVAVKLLHPGRDDPAALARFDAERQSLALMDHPNIAAVYDGGTAPGGEPFLVMELVNGEPITRHCARHGLPTADRLALVAAACDALEHAHRKGVIHRDVKPSNVLVADVDGRPVVKVIDFGIAKLTGPAHADAAETLAGVLVGTPAYMSPEQAGANPLDVDTRTDVYGLGVLLYELLTGATPWDSDAAGPTPVAEVLRRVREDEPPRPGARLGRGRLPADLDWLVLKALAKDRDRRYGSAADLAADLRRFLAGEAVTAHPPAWTYRAGKFARRHAVPVAAAAAVLLALVGGILGTSVGLVRARAAEARAIIDRNDATAAHAESQHRLGQIERGSDLLAGLFRNLNARGEGGGANLSVTMADRLTTAAGQLDGDAFGDPLTVAKLQTDLAAALTSLGYPGRAVPLLEKAQTARSTGLGPDHDLAQKCQEQLAVALREAGRPSEAVPLFEAAVRQRVAAGGPDHPATLHVKNSLAVTYRATGRTADAIRLYEDVYRAADRPGADIESITTYALNLAAAYRQASRASEAVPLAERALALRTEKLGPDHAQTLHAQGTLALLLHATGRPDRALMLVGESYRGLYARLGPDHPSTVTQAFNLARMSPAADAVPLYEEVAAALAKRRYEHPRAADIVPAVAQALADAGHGEKAAEVRAGWAKAKP